MANLEHSVDDRSFRAVTGDHLDPQHVELRSGDNARYVTQQARAVGALDDDRRAENLATLQPRPAYHDAALRLTGQQCPQIRAIGAVNDNAPAACDEAIEIVAR